jgi:predicted SprT family Zn-dependent metalloprotease
MGMYATDTYTTYLARIRADYPDYEILEPKLLYHCHAEWLEEYEKLRTGRQIDLFIFFRDREDYIGRGVMHEMCGLVCPKILLTESGYIQPDDYDFKRGINNLKYVRVVIKKKRTVKSVVVLD